jgi:outer membrane protein assembly factor BamA
MATPAFSQAQQEKLRELEQENADLQAQVRLLEYASRYQVQLNWPAKVDCARTNKDLVLHRLLEAGVHFEVPTSISETGTAVAEFVDDLQKTDCFNNVAVEIGLDKPSDREAPHALNVSLSERNWYKLHLGGGLKTNAFFQPESASGFLPTAEVELTAGLRNLTGHLDKTDLQYGLDSKSSQSWLLSHERPLYTILPSSLSDWLLTTPQGSRASLQARGFVDTVDYEKTRSYREYARVLSVRASNQHAVAKPEQAKRAYLGIEWSLQWRDLVPRRHASLPFCYAASPEIVSLSGPSWKHAVTTEYRSNGALVDDPYNPTQGLQFHYKTEVALPPGSVGFAKAQGGLAVHSPLTETVTWHNLVHVGYLRNLTFGGLCIQPATLSDRFYSGGPLQLRGFSPAGVGPRAKTSSKTAVGDALGGNFYTTLTSMVSVSPMVGLPAIDEKLGLRLFGFLTGGTCVNVNQWNNVAVLSSMRASAGVGLVSTALGPRLEMTYAIPLRFAHVDVQQNFAFGFGFTME